MPRSRFVTPEVVRLQLSDGDWIDVKKRLSVGEERAAFQQIVGDVAADGRMKPNYEMIGLAQVASYIVNWSFVDEQGIGVAFSVEALRNLDPESYRELDAAIDAHIKRIDAQLRAEKNGSGGEIGPVTISPSVS